MEKGKYLHLKIPKLLIKEIEIFEITEKCYRIYENSGFHWILKEDFDKKYQIVEKIIKKEEPKNEKKRWFRKQ